MWENIVWSVCFGLPIVIGGIAMGLTPPELNISRVCFIVSALVVLARFSWWIYVEQQFESKLIPLSFIIIAFLVIGLILGSGLQWIKNRELIIKPTGKSVSVNPYSWIVKTGLDEEFMIKVTNNRDYPLYMVQVKIRPESGDLSLHDVFISWDGSPINRNEIKNITPPPPNHQESSIKIGGGQLKTIVHEKSDQKYAKLVGGILRDEEGLFLIHIVDQIDGHTTRTFPVFIRKERMKSITKLLFSIRGSLKNPCPVYSQIGKNSSGMQSLTLPGEGEERDSCE